MSFSESLLPCLLPITLVPWPPRSSQGAPADQSLLLAISLSLSLSDYVITITTFCSSSPAPLPWASFACHGSCCCRGGRRPEAPFHLNKYEPWLNLKRDCSLSLSAELVDFWLVSRQRRRHRRRPKCLHLWHLASHNSLSLFSP